MPRYDAKRIEAKWQAYWDQHGTFAAPNVPPPNAAGKLYVLDMFPYPSGDGLHVGHPEGYTATDIVCRYSRMRGKHVLHPMGWDAFGLPAEEHAIKTGTHPRITTEKNIGTFRRQLKMLGFSYDWTREFATTDPDYYRWTQWIFLQLFDTWYDPEFTWTGPDGVQRTGKGRPIAELPIPDDVRSQGETAVRRYQDQNRLAYQHEAPVNWCPALGTVLANEEVIDGKSERGNHPVQRIPLRQWMLRITAYADRLMNELEPLHWSESIKTLQRNWIGRSEGAEVDFFVEPVSRDAKSSERSVSSTSGGRKPLDSALNASGDRNQGANAPRSEDFETWKQQRTATGFPKTPDDTIVRVYTTRPDTLFGVTYMVLAPEHPLVDRITTPGQKAAVDAYRTQASLKSDLDRTDLAKDKTGVFTGGYAINPVNGERVPIWIADYVLISYGTGAIMAVPAHDERDFEFAKQFGIAIKPVVINDGVKHQETENDYTNNFTSKGGYAITEIPTNDPKVVVKTLEKWLQENGISQDYVRINSYSNVVVVIQYRPFENLTWFGSQPFATCGLNQHDENPGKAINSGPYTGLATAEFKPKITADLASAGLGRKAVNYRLRDWLFSRQRYWGEPFPIWHELDADGNPTGLMRTDAEAELPVILPDMADFQPTGTPEPLLSKAPDAWLYRTAADGTRLKRETNSMPQWAGSCWYYLRFADPKNADRFIDPAIENYWLPVDLYIGGAEHAVLHLLYSRFWHKVLFDRGYVSHPEPFGRLVNQGMILGEMLHRITIRFTWTCRSPASLTDSELVALPLDWRLKPEPWPDIPISGSLLSLERVKPADLDVTDNGVRHRRHPDIELLERLNSVGEKEYFAIIEDHFEPVSASEISGGPLQGEGMNEPYIFRYIDEHDVEKRGEHFVLKSNTDIRIDSRSYKMSKSRGNVINPDHVVGEYGADSLRMYEMFMGPLEATKPWSMAGVDGVYRFLGRVWRLFVDDRAEDVTLHSAVQDVPPTPEQQRLLHKTIKVVTEDLDKLSFNTALSRMMEFTNEMTAADIRPKAVLEPFVLLISPLAPHIAEELWELLGHPHSLAYEPWPAYDPALLVENEIAVPVQVNGKLRGKITVPADADQPAIEAAARADAAVASQLAGKTVVKVVYVPGRLLNFVVK